MPIAPKPRPNPNKPEKARDYREHGAAERGYDWEWAKAKPALMREMTIVAEIDPFCRYCRTAKATMLDHASPPSRKGSVGSATYNRWFKDKRYLVPACSHCNTDKSDMLPEELKKQRPEMYERLLAFLEKRGVSVDGR